MQFHCVFVIRTFLHLFGLAYRHKYTHFNIMPTTRQNGKCRLHTHNIFFLVKFKNRKEMRTEEETMIVMLPLKTEHISKTIKENN